MTLPTGFNPEVAGFPKGAAHAPFGGELPKGSGAEPLVGSRYMDFYEYVVDTYDDMNYIEVLRSYSSHFERLTRGNHHKWEQGCLCVSDTSKCVVDASVTSPPTQKQHKNTHENTHENTQICCPNCGSISIIKYGKTLANKPRFRCKDCGKSFLG